MESTLVDSLSVRLVEQAAVFLSFRFSAGGGARNLGEPIRCHSRHPPARAIRTYFCGAGCGEWQLWDFEATPPTFMAIRRR
jgi:hypothetical protein